MRKNFSSTLSMTLAGLLAVGSVGMTPITAFAADSPQPTDKIAFAKGDFTSSTLVNDEVTVVENEPAAGQVTLATKLPGTYGTTNLAFESAPTIEPGFDFAWFDGTNYIREGAEGFTKTYGDLTRENPAEVGDPVATLTAKKVGKEIKIEYGVATEGAYSFPASGAQKPVTKVYGTKFDNAISDVTLEGYEFTGWDLDGIAGYEIPKSAQPLTQSQEIDDRFLEVLGNGQTTVTLTPVFVEKTYKFTFNKNGMETGTIPGDVSGKYSEIEDETIAEPTAPSRKGYSLPADGFWSYTDAKGTKHSLAADADYGDVIALMGDATTAQLDLDWSEGEYTFVLDWSASIGNCDIDLSDNKWVEETEVEQGDPEPIAVKTGYASPFANDGKVKYTDTVVLPTVVSGDVLDSSNEMSFESDEYNFLGWAKTAGATKADYKDGKAVKVEDLTPVEGKVTLYAVLEEKPAEEQSYTVSYGRNGGSLITGKEDPEDIENVKVGSTITLPQNPYEKEKFTFVGWTIGTLDTVYTEKQKVEITEKIAEEADREGFITIAPKWDLNYFMLEKYDGTKNLGKIKVLVTDDTKLDDTTLTSGETFLGWDTDSSVVNPKYDAETSASELYETYGGTVKIYAIGAAKTVDITYRDPADNTNKAYATVAANSKVTLNTKLNSANSDLVGWTLNKGYADEAAAKAAGEKIYTEYDVKESDLTFYAVFKAKTLTVIFDPNGNEDDVITGTMSNVTAEYDSKLGGYFIAIPDNQFKNAGYTFSAWQDERGDALGFSADKKKIKVIDTVAGTEKEVKIYAGWSANHYRVSFDKNSEKATGTKKNLVVSIANGGADTLDNLVQGEGFEPEEGKIFVGWALVPDATKAEFTEENTIADLLRAANAEDNATITVYAIWDDTDAVKVEKAQAEAAAAKAEAEAANAEAAAQKTAADAAKADAATQKAAADAASKDAASQKAAADAAKKDAAAQKTAADAAKADAAAQKKAADDAKAAQTAAENKVANQYKKLTKQKLSNGYTVNTFACGEATITAIDAKKIKGNVTVPGTVTVKGKKYKVTKVANKVFNKKTKIKQITFHKNIISIGNLACGNNKNLVKVTIKGKNVHIGAKAFYKMNTKGNIIAANTATRNEVKANGKQPKTVKVTKKAAKATK